jgi:hypothetical protein
MTRRLLIALPVLFTTILAAPSVGHAQAFKVEKFDIKGEGGTDYVAVEAATGRVFVSRANHMMVVEGATGKVLGDIPNTPGVHGAGIATKAGHGFTTNGGDQTVTMFDLRTLAVLRQIKVGPGLDGIMYDEPDDKIILTNHSRPIGTLTALDPKTGDIVATVELEDTAPEGAAANCPSRIFGGARVLCFVKRIQRSRSAAGIGQPVGFGWGGGWTDAPVARQPKSDTTVPL